jgi:hypothetical protein
MVFRDNLRALEDGHDNVQLAVAHLWGSQRRYDLGPFHPESGQETVSLGLKTCPALKQKRRSACRSRATRGSSTLHCSEKPVLACRGSKLDEHRADAEKLIRQCRGNLRQVH